MIEDRSAEIPRQWRPQLRHIAIAGRRAAQRIGGRARIGLRKLLLTLGAVEQARAQGHPRHRDQTDRADRGNGDDDAAPEPDRARWPGAQHQRLRIGLRSEEHTSELQSLMRISYAVFCLKKKTY